jgi:metal-sulfur cluster biosynthetic enzyme
MGWCSVGERGDNDDLNELSSKLRFWGAHLRDQDSVNIYELGLIYEVHADSAGLVNIK